MTDTVTTRIRLPDEIHRQVKAQAAYHGVNLDQALGMCVAYLCSMTTPLLWVEDEPQVMHDVTTWVMQWDRVNPVP